jgi:hypothetical protein
MNSKVVQQFFASWNTTEEEKDRLRAFVTPVVEHQPLSMDNVDGFTVEKATPYVSTWIEM